ncbi:Holliday junction branch migration protein RuvA [Kiritimatiellota bacterium B12222]|nr:Holliday junction branch migration protein RuvA [Kiritimatiellota bacterium B12222]
MIEFVSGKLVEKTPTRAIVQTGGIGLQLLIPLSSYDALPALGEEVTLLTQMVVREDSMTLYGFFTPEERETFDLLTTVTGIGPKLGLTALSGMPLSDLQNAIAGGDIKRLNSITGIGKKMAERMVVELKDKIAAAGIAHPLTSSTPPSSHDRDAVLALVALGYKQQDATKLLDKVKSLTGRDDHSVEELVRLALSGK